MLRCPLDGAGIFEQLELVTGFIEGVKASGAEEDDGVADALAAESGERLRIFGQDANDASVGAVEEGRIFVGERGTVESIRCFAGHGVEFLTSDL